MLTLYDRFSGLIGCFSCLTNSFKCPKCGEESDIEGEELPELACDSKEWECPKCGQTMKIGWYATVEER